MTGREFAEELVEPVNAGVVENAGRSRSNNARIRSGIADLRRKNGELQQLVQELGERNTEMRSQFRELIAQLEMRVDDHDAALIGLSDELDAEAIARVQADWSVLVLRSITVMPGCNEAGPDFSTDSYRRSLPEPAIDKYHVAAAEGTGPALSQYRCKSGADFLQVGSDIMTVGQDCGGSGPQVHWRARAGYSRTYERPVCAYDEAADALPAP